MDQLRLRHDEKDEVGRLLRGRSTSTARRKEAALNLNAEGVSMRIGAARPRLTRASIALVAALASLLLLNVGTSWGTTSSSYPNVVFSDGFESGSLSAWDGTGGGNGTASVTAGAKHTGTY